jgi:hypothetical protein
MIFSDTPKRRRELDRQLDPYDPVLLDSDLNRVVGDLNNLARIMLRSIRAMSPAEKRSVRDALNERLPGFTEADVAYLRSIGVSL